TGTGLSSPAPSSLTFSGQNVGTTSAAQAVTLSNPSGVALTITGIGFTGTNPGDFGQTNNCPLSPSTLAANGTCTINVTFTPTATGSRSATLTVTDNASNNPQTAGVSGMGVSLPALSPSPVPDFGNQNVGTTSSAHAVPFSSPSGVALTITSIGFTGTNPGDFGQTNNCPLSPSTLAANGTCTLNVTFTPTATGARSATLTVTDNASNSPQTAGVSGTGTAPPSLSPSPVPSFGSQNVNTTSAAQVVTLSNPSGAALTITSIGFTGTNPGDFGQTNNCPLSPSTLAANGTCTINVTFTPTATGSRSATLAVTDNASNSPQTAGVSGTGVGPTATLSPTSLTFSKQNVNTTSPPKTVTLSNTGNAPLTINSISITGANANNFALTSASTCPLSGGTVAAPGNCTIVVTFTPTSKGGKSGAISVADNASGSPQQVSLTGTGH